MINCLAHFSRVRLPKAGLVAALWSALCLSALTPVHSAHAASCTATPSGLVGFWNGDSAANDTAGTNHGVLFGGASVTNAGLVGNAFTFDGTNSYVQIADNAALRPTNLTIEAWVRFSGLDSAGTAGAGQQYIIFKENTRTATQGYFEGYNLLKVRDITGDKFAFIVSLSDTQSVELDSSTLISTGVWYHVAGVRGTNFAQLYVNGLLQQQSSVTFTQSYGAFPLLFGTSGQTNWDRKLKGSLDEVSLYNRALSSNEIVNIFNAGANGKCRAPSISIQPQSQSVAAGANIAFNVTAAGTAPLAYRWRLAGTNIPGATASSYNIASVQPDTLGSYSAVITNSFGSATSATAVLSFLLPPNDAFSNAIVLTGIETQMVAYTFGATRETNEPCAPWGFDTNDCSTSIWWSFTPPSDGLVTLRYDTLWNDQNFIYTLLTAYQGSNVTALTDVMNNRYIVAATQTNNIRFDVLGGKPYRFSAYSVESPSTFNFSFTYTAAQPNNYFSNRVVIPFGTNSVLGSNVGANKETNEPAHATTNANRSVWWSWTPTQSVSTFLTTFGSTFDTVLDVYRGTNLATLSLIASNNDAFVFDPTNVVQRDLSSRVRFDASAGTNYQFCVSGAGGDSGGVALNLTPLGIENITAFSRALSAGTNSVLFTNTLRITNLRTNSTGPLRVRLVARAGYGFLDGQETNTALLASIIRADQPLGTFTLSSPSTIGPSNSITTTVNGLCPAPIEDLVTFFKWGIGWGVLAYLEEQVGGDWLTCDGRLLAVGEWPRLNGFAGPGGGVITVMVSSGNYHLGYLRVNVGPQAALNQGGGWRVPGTPYYPGYSQDNNLLITFATSGTKTVEFQQIPGWSLASSTNVNVQIGQDVSLSAAYVAPPGNLMVVPAGALAFGGFNTGPFTPTNVLCLLTNTGGTNLNWSATGSTTWITFTPASGTLGASAGTNISIRVNSNANSLVAGNYTNILTFTNLSGGLGTTNRTATLVITNHPIVQLNSVRIITSNRVAMTLQGVTNGVYSIVTSTNLLTPLSNWSEVLRVTNTIGLTTFTNSSRTNSSRYYRAREF